MIDPFHTDARPLFVETGSVGQALMVMALTLVTRLPHAWDHPLRLPASPTRASFLPVIKGNFFTSLQSRRGDVSCDRRSS